MREMAKRAPRALLLAALLLGGSSAWADAPGKAVDDTKAAPSKASAKGQAQAVPAPDAPLDPRWKVRSWTISGLTVWTFRPGHFVRN
ncbi:hypothetical protein [Aquabacter cavernae]|uniref:hypothetical protein n=1 Tax=Aquabacter cavernae TaxID=2496029 RepID=UPI000F8F72FA|nr:hypothetical protein [Aquabacter cavernae]